ncbi:TadE family protein [Actinomadura sp. DC4]|uniref:TadE/TadG family type IV pilus assembly protein n=1 Tax=Actinomadura sp. DC4 TaxID=3055069 RepID=UPI0025B05370|nr:TadE family protein [Actinomadura sp. DC4]MDN3356896.1 pilus assembly protein [Actinomadura sp. DC4]
MNASGRRLRRGPGCEGHRDRGAAITEYIAVFPVALAVILFAFEGLMSGMTVERVENAARTGARVASQRQDAGACRGSALGVMPGWINRRKVVGGWRDDGVYCHVRADIPVLWPGAPLDFTIDRTVHMPVG